MRHRLAVLFGAVAVGSLLVGAFGMELVPGPARLVRDIAGSPSDGSNPLVIGEIDGTLLLEASDRDHGRELWKTDGTTAGTVLVKDLDPGPATSFDGFFRAMVVVGRTLYFMATDRTHGHELWKSDGTEAGTMLVKDINQQSFDGYPLDSFPTSFVEHDGALYFAADDGLHGYELWRSDGTEAGTVLVKDIYPDAFDFGMVGWFSEVNGTLLFAANDEIHGRELWRTDGTEAGTVLVKDIVPGSAHAFNSLAFSRLDLNGAILFVAEDPAYQSALWKSDGTEAGTVLVKDLCVDDCRARAENLSGGAVVGGELYFPVTFFPPSGTDGTYELWKTDGTEEGTVRLKAFPWRSSPGISRLIGVDGTLFFYADDGMHGGELWKSDGTEEGTVLVKDIRPGESGSADTGNATRFAVIGGTLCFTADDGTHGIELWRSDGTEEGTVLVDDIAPGIRASRPAQITEIGGSLLFKADDGVHGQELWRSDGTEAGTVLVQDIASGPGGTGTFFSNVPPILAGNRVLFATNDGTRGNELWAGRAAVLTGRPLRAVQDLQAEMTGLGLPRGIERVLARELDEALAAIARPGGEADAVAALETFMRKVEAIGPHKISAAARSSLLEFASDNVEMLRHPS